MMEDMVKTKNALWVSKLLTLEEREIQNVTTVRNWKDKSIEPHANVVKWTMSVILAITELIRVPA